MKEFLRRPQHTENPLMRLKPGKLLSPMRSCTPALTVLPAKPQNPDSSFTSGKLPC